MALWGSACGVQGPTRPPRVEQPERVTDLAAMQVGKSVRLSFTLPRNATDGERLTKAQEVEILRGVSTVGAPAPPSDADLKPWRTLSTEEVEKLKLGESVIVTVALAENQLPAAHIRFAVRTRTRGFRNRPRESDPSPSASLTLLPVPDAIEGLQATTAEKAIELSWKAPVQPVTAYRLFRSPTGAADSFRMMAETRGLVYHDSDFEFGRSYFYRVNGIVQGNGSTAASEDSQAVEITARDTFPPAPPRGLTALYTTDAVELIWNASTEPDLAGYNVFRRAADAPAQKINSDPLPTPILRDTSVTARQEYVYQVTALDLAGNESPRSQATVAETR